MSRIYFHGESGEAEVLGSERAHFGVFCTDLAWAFLRFLADDDLPRRNAKLRQIFPDDHYLHRLEGRQFAESARIALSVGFDDKLVLGDERIDIFKVQLNTALAIGNDPVKLAARLHGQCEIHAWVEGKNREWLAGIIQEGCESGFYRAGQGWPEVMALLRETDAGPVVTSYSVCEQFPNASVANFEPTVIDREMDYDAWYDLPLEEQWRRAMEGLRGRSGRLEMRPDNWQAYRFGTGLDAMGLVERILYQ